MDVLGMSIILPEWMGFAATPGGTFALNLLLWLAIAWLAYAVSRVLVRQLTRRSRTTIDDLILGIIRKPIVLLLLALGFVNSWRAAYGPSDATDLLGRLYNGLLIIMVAHMAWRLLFEVIIARLEPIVRASDSQADDIIIPMLKRIGPVIIIIAVANALVTTLGGTLSTLLASLGLLGVVLGYLLQEPLQGLFSGTYMALDNPFREDDLLILEDGSTCQVREIGVRVTHLYDVKRHMVLFVPNARLAKDKITNLTKPSVEFRTVLNVTIQSSGGCNAAIALLQEACNSHENVLGLWPRKRAAIRRRQAAYRATYIELASQSSPSLAEEAQKFWLQDHMTRLDGDLIRLQVEDALRDRSEVFSQGLLNLFHYFTQLEDGGRVLGARQQIRERVAAILAQFDDLVEQITVWLFLVRVIESEVTDQVSDTSIARFIDNDLLRDGRLTLAELASCQIPNVPNRPIVKREDVARIRSSEIEAEKATDHVGFADRGAYVDYRRLYGIWHRNITHVYRGLEGIYHFDPLANDDEKSLSQRVRDVERHLSDTFLLRVSHWQLPFAKLVDVTGNKHKFELSFFVDDVVREHFQRSERVATELLMEIERLQRANKA